MRKIILFSLIVLLLSGCNFHTSDVPSDTTVNDYQNYSTVDNNEYDYGKEKDMNLTNDTKIKLNLRGVPKDLRYMWESDSFGQEMPEKNQICRIALYWYQPAYQDDPMSSLYECIDFSNNKIVYRSSQTPGMETTEYNLSEEDKTRYLENIDYQLFTTGVEANNKWNVSIEFEDGNCYLYNLSYERTDKNNPRRIMLKTLFDKVEMTEVDYSYSGFKN